MIGIIIALIAIYLIGGVLVSLVYVYFSESDGDYSFQEYELLPMIFFYPIRITWDGILALFILVRRAGRKAHMKKERERRELEAYGREVQMEVNEVLRKKKESQNKSVDS